MFVSNASAGLPNPCALLTKSQLETVLGKGTPTNTAETTSYSRTCTWSGPPEGLMQERQQFTVTVNPETRAQFARHRYKDIPRPDPIIGLGYPAFAEFGGEFVIWKDGLQLDLAGTYLSVYPAGGVRLARSVLKLL